MNAVCLRAPAVWCYVTFLGLAQCNSLEIAVCSCLCLVLAIAHKAAPNVFTLVHLVFDDTHSTVVLAAQRLRSLLDSLETRQAMLLRLVCIAIAQVT